MQETIYGVYRNFGGIHVATSLEVKIDGKPYRRQELTEFKILDKVDPSTFSTPADAGGPEREANTVPGPETDKLLPATSGYDLALSPAGGRVAFLSGLENTQMPGALLHTGTVEIAAMYTEGGQLYPQTRRLSRTGRRSGNSGRRR